MVEHMNKIKIESGQGSPHANSETSTHFSVSDFWFSESLDSFVD